MVSIHSSQSFWKREKLLLMKSLFFILTWIGGTMLSCFAEEPLSEEATLQIESQIESHQKTIKTLRASFTQTVLPPHQKKPVISRGLLLYRQPQTLRIDYHEPQGDGMILTPQETLSWKKGMLTQVTPNDPQKPSFRRVLLDVLEKSPRDWQKQYHRKMIRTNSNYEVRLTPLRPDASLPQNITAQLRLSDFQLTEIAVHFASFTWKIQLHSLELNPVLKIRLER